MPIVDKNNPQLQVFPIQLNSPVRKHIKNFEETVEKTCQAHPHYQTPEYEKCVRGVYPHYINFSVGYRTEPEDFTYVKYKNWPKKEKQEIEKDARNYFHKKASDSLTEQEIKKILQYKKDKLEDIYEDISSAFARASFYSTLVQSAGNNAGKPVSSVAVQNSQSAKTIIVGSLAPNGSKSSFSQEHPEVHIMAPADKNIRTTNAFGQAVYFGGTSASAPLVTGALVASFNWMSGYHPTPEESKILLRMTAVPHKYSNNKPRTNGFGMLNAYKIGMLGKKLKEKCGGLKHCFKMSLRDDKTYNDLLEKDKNLFKDMEKTFPECSQLVCAKPAQATSSCSEKKEVLKRLRKQAFLRPWSHEMWRHLSCIYAGAGFKDTSESMINSYTALFQHDKTHADRHYCEKDEDCVLVPECPQTVYASKREAPQMKALNRMMAEAYYNLEYYGKCRQKPRCNDKCRCGNRERVLQKEETDPKTGGKMLSYAEYKASCVKAQCVLSTDKVLEKAGQSKTAPKGPAKATKPAPLPGPALESAKGTSAGSVK